MSVNSDLSIRFPQAAFIHPTVCVYGNVRVEEGASLWPHGVIRAENHHIAIGRFSNVQDLVMIHTGWETPTIVGDYCSVTHHCTLHGCTIGDNCLIGINSTVMDGVVIGDNCVVAGHTIVKEGTRIPSNSIVMGVPGRVVRTVNSFVANRINAMAYHRNALAYAEGNHRAWTGPDYEEFMKRLKTDLAAEFARGTDQGRNTNGRASG